MKKVIINLGKGSLYGGCNSVIVQLLDRQRGYSSQEMGSLPPAPELADLHRQWQSLYRALNQDQSVRINLMRSGGLRYSEVEFRRICQEFPQKLNQWLDSQEFQPLIQTLRTELGKNEVIQVIIATEDDRLRQIPWHLWNFFEDYTQAEVALSSLNWRERDCSGTPAAKVRILAILGSSEGIDLQADCQALATLPNTELVVLKEPKLRELNDHLWQEEGWDILLFSGHSNTESDEGRIHLNAHTSLTIAQLQNSLQKAIANGLKIAIFNSCEGMGLALELADLSIPYTVFMREPIPDRIAQAFLQYFLTAFAAGKPFSLAIREARQKLEGWETEFACASWLPAIWQNPAINALSWHDLQATPQIAQIQEKPYKLRCKALFLTSLIISSLTLGMRSLGVLEPVELWSYDHLMRQRPPETIDPRIVVVEITEDDTNNDRYPIEDTTLVRLLDRLSTYQPRAIGLDLHRSHARGKGYADLIQRFKQNSHIFPVCSYGSTEQSYAPPGGISPDKLTYQMGFSDLIFDEPRSQSNLNSTVLTQARQLPMENLIVRRQLLSYDPTLAVSPSSCITPYSLSFRLAYEYLQQQDVEPIVVNSAEQWQFGEVVFSEMPAKFAAYQQLDGQSSQIPLNYRSQQPGQKITATDILSGKVEPQLIRGRIVLIGYTAPVARDYFATPYGTMPGVWIHAHMTSQIVSTILDRRPLIWTLPQWQGIQWGDWLWILAWSVAGGVVVIIFAKRSLIYLGLSTGILILVLHQACLLSLVKGGWMPYIPSLVSLLVTVGVLTIQSLTKQASPDDKPIITNKVHL